MNAVALIYYNDAEWAKAAPLSADPDGPVRLDAILTAVNALVVRSRAQLGALAQGYSEYFDWGTPSWGTLSTHARSRGSSEYSHCTGVLRVF